MYRFALFLLSLLRYRATRAAAKQIVERKPSKPIGTVEYSGLNGLPMWTAVSLDFGIPGMINDDTRIIGVVVPSPVGGTLFVNGSFDLDKWRPPGRYLVVRMGNASWVDHPKLTDRIVVTTINNKLFKEFAMSYATGKSDFSDFEFHANQPASGWTSAPAKYQPVHLNGGNLVPSKATTEAIYAIVLESQEIKNESNEVTGYDIKVLIASAVLVDDSLNIASNDVGQPLFVQNYDDSSTPSFSDMYSTAAPTEGYTHPLFIAAGTDKLKFAPVRPDAV